MKNKRIGILLFSLQIILCLFLNWAGDQLVSRLNWPVWLDSVGTVLAAYLLGPFCGAVIGATTNLLAHILYGIAWYYALISILIAVIVGIASKRGKMKDLLGTLTVGTIVAGAATIAAYPLNLLLSGCSTGNTWGDAVIGLLSERGFPRWGGLLIAQLYVELLDKILILVTLYLIIRLIDAVTQRIRGKNEEISDKGEETETDDDIIAGAGKTIAEAPAHTDPKPLFETAGAAPVSENSVKTTESARVQPNSESSASPVTRALSLLLAVGLALVFAGSSGLARAENNGTADAGTDAHYNNYVQTIYSTSNGLPCGEANDIAMTSDGIMWIGTYAGLYRYNGREFRWMDGLDSVRNVNCLYVDEEGRLWIGTNDNGLSILIGEQVVNVIDQIHGLPANSVKSIIKSSDGYYYIGTTGSMQVLTLNCGLRQVCVLSEVSYADHSAADQKGNVAAVNNDGTLFLLRQGQIVASRRMLGTGDVFRSCVFDPNGNLLAATTGNRIFKFRITRGAFEPLKVIECPGLQNIKNMQYLDNGTLFICADNGIAYIPSGGSYEKINTNEFNNSIDNMLVDYQQNLWFTSSRLGLLRLAPSDFRDIYAIAGMENRVVNAIVQWQDAWYFGTDKGMDAVDLTGKTQIHDTLTERFAGTRIRCMLVDRDDHLWVCTYGAGLVEIMPDGTEYLYNRENGAFGNRARVAQQLSDGTILAAGDTGLSFIRDHRVERTIGHSEGKITSMVLTITEMRDGRILAGTDGNGLAVIENGKVTRMLTRQDGLSSEVILRTVPDSKDGGIFVVTSNGLCYMNSDESVRTLDNFPYYNNYDIWIRGTDDLFVLSSAGIYTVDRTELLSGKEEIGYDLLNSRRGLNGSLTANAWTWFNESTGELSLPCDTGVFVIDTNAVSSGAKLYRMSVTGVRTDGEFHRIERNVTTRIDRGTSRLEILPEVINYTIQDPYVGYMLEGFDQQWTIVPQNTLSTISYTNLPTGRFVFHLAVFDNNQESILAERTYSFIKEKAMYDNGWFIVYILTVPMFTVFWVTWMLVRRRQRIMEEQLVKAELQAEMGKQTVIAIARTVDAKDERTSEHSKRVAIYSEKIARAAHMDEKQCQDIKWAAQMHDIGKIAIPDHILNKNSRLTDEEYALMKSHTTRGAEILKDFTLLNNVIDGAEFHHERYDGRGYPKGLKGEEIPLFARIIGVADAFDAMTANRIYRKQMDFSYVLNELEKGRGTQFDPQFVDLLLKLIHDGEIDLNKIYHVSREASEEAEKAAEAARQNAQAATAEAEKPKSSPAAPAEAEKPKSDPAASAEATGAEQGGNA